MVYRSGEKAIGIGNLPRSKRKCLYVQDGCIIRKVASFTSDQDAEMFERRLQYFLGISDTDGVKDEEAED